MLIVNIRSWPILTSTSWDQIAGTVCKSNLTERLYETQSIVKAVRCPETTRCFFLSFSPLCVTDTGTLSSVSYVRDIDPQDIIGLDSEKRSSGGWAMTTFLLGSDLVASCHTLVLLACRKPGTPRITNDRCCTSSYHYLHECVQTASATASARMCTVRILVQYSITHSIRA